MKHMDLALLKKEAKEHLLGDDGIITRASINVALPDIAELYNRLDPSALGERSLNHEVTEYLYERVDRVPRFSQLTIRLSVSAAQGVNGEDVAVSISNYFGHKALDQLISNRRMLRKWLWNLLLGTVVLSIFLFGAHLLKLHAAEVPFFAVLSEGLSIVGWVALWEPANYFLFDIRNDNAVLRRYMRLHRAKVCVLQTEKTDI